MDQISLDLSISSPPSEEDEEESEEVKKKTKEEEKYKLKIVQINVDMLSHTVNSFRETSQKIYKDSIHVRI